MFGIDVVRIGDGKPPAPRGCGQTPTLAGPKGQIRFTAVGPGTWVVPPGITEVYVECVGGGGGGAGGEALTPGVGGGGGAYAAALYPVVPGASVPYEIGTGGAGAPLGDGSSGGGDTTFDTAGVVAKGGGGTGPGATPGTGGLVAFCVGTVKYAGADGGISADEFTSGAGGGASGRTGPGETSTDFNGGIGVSPGGNGGSGATNNSLPTAAGIGGGGGGGWGAGAYTDPTDGGAGVLIISWGYLPS